MSNDPNRRKPKGPQPGNDDENRKARRIVMLIVAALIATLLINSLYTTISNAYLTEITYTEFKELLTSDKISEVEFQSDDRIVILTKDQAEKSKSQQRLYYTGLIPNQDTTALTNQLDAANVKYNRDLPEEVSPIVTFLVSWVLPVVFMYALFSLLMRGMDEMVAKMVELRKGKMTDEECRAALSKGNYFGTMLVKLGKADALLGGATYSTADTVRPALQLVKTKKGAHLVSSSFILFRKDKDGNDEKYCMGDCAINIDYPDTLDKTTGEVVFSGAQKLAEVAVESARTAAFFGIDPKVALLSFSTKGSGKGGTVKLSHDATIEAQKLAPELAIDGEMQFDAAVSPVVGQLKFPGSKVAGYANTFIFPCIEAGNIGYKIAQRLGGFEAYGPILQGLNAPINDLSRGCNAEEVYQMSIITAALA